jgi:type I restriction enzyme S subunit
MYSIGINKFHFNQTTGIQNLDTKSYLREFILLPPLPLQAQIVSFLDVKVSAIDRLVEAKRRQIELLKEWKRAAINEELSANYANSRENPISENSRNSRTKKEWKKVRLKNLAQINPTKSGKIIDKKDLAVFLPMENVSVSGYINCEIKKPIYELTSGFTYFEKNDVIVAKITPCFENGKSALLDKLETEIGFGSTEFHTLRAKENLIPKYLYYIVKSEEFMKTGEAFMVGSAGQKRVTTDFISNYEIAVPPLPIQQAIVKKLDIQCAKADNLLAKLRDEISLFAEYKTRLISDVVTGKMSANYANSRENLISENLRNLRTEN